MLTNHEKTADDRRLCKQNLHEPSLRKSFAAISSEVDDWIANKTESIKAVQFRSNGEIDHTRFEAFK